MKVTVAVYIATVIKMSSHANVAAFQLTSGTIQSSSNLSLSYVEKCNGDGPTTLFIHGLDSSSHTWRNVQQSLATPSVAIDCRSCGKSDLGNPLEFTPDALVEDIKSLVNAHPLLQSKFVLVGHSMGGRIAMCYAAKYPQDVSALVIEDMDIQMRSAQPSFFENFDEDKAITFERNHETILSIQHDLEIIGYTDARERCQKWYEEGRIYKVKDGTYYCSANPAFRALCYKTVFGSNCGEESWKTIAQNLHYKKLYPNISLMIAGIGTVCSEESINDMRRIISSVQNEGEQSPLSIKTYAKGTHSIHNSAQEEFMTDLCEIINSVR